MRQPARELPRRTGRRYPLIPTDVSLEVAWIDCWDKTPIQMEEIYRLYTRDKPRLLKAIMSALASDNSRISFEGSLSQSELMHIEGVTHEENGVLKRATLRPKLDFVVFPLTQKNLSAITKAVSKIAFGHKGVIHVQVEKDGKIAFAAYDNFHPNYVAAYSAVPLALLDKLKETRVLRGYSRVPQPNN